MSLDDHDLEKVDDAASDESSVLSDNSLSDNDGEDEAILMVNSSLEPDSRSEKLSLRDTTNLQNGTTEKGVEPAAKRKKIAIAKSTAKISTCEVTRLSEAVIGTSDEKTTERSSKTTNDTMRKPDNGKRNDGLAKLAWIKECNLSLKEGKLAWDALGPTEQKNIEARLSKKKFTARVVPKVCGMRILGPGQDIPEPKKLTIRSKQGKELFTKTLMQNGWKVEAFSNKVTYWSPGAPPIAFTSLSQIAEAFPSLLPK